MTIGSGAENYGVVFALAESPRKAGLLWAGTDDGKLWVTEDEGGNWTDLTASLPAAAKGQWIARIEPGHADDRVAYLVVSAYRTRQLRAARLSHGGPAGAPGRASRATCPPTWPARVVREDPAEPGPAVRRDGDRPVRELRSRGDVDAVRRASAGARGRHPASTRATHDLVIATHGRSLYIVDDISAARAA